MSSVGRPMLNVYNELKFVPLKVNKKHAARCCVCGKVLKSTAKDRLKAHRRVCQNKQNVVASTSGSESQAEQDTNQGAHTSSTPDLATDNDVNVDDPEYDQEASQVSLDFSEPSQSSSSGAGYFESHAKHSRRSSSVASNSTLSSFVDVLDRSAKEEIDVALGTFLFGCNVPFSVVESVHFKNFCKKMRPAYQVPARKTVANVLIDKVHDKVHESTKIGPYSVMLIDGWKNEANNTKNVAVFLHNALGSSEKSETVFLDAWDLSGEAETGDRLCEIVKEASTIAKLRFNSDVYCTVSDNAANMVRMSKDHNLWHSACNSHTANLLAKDLLPGNISTRIVSVLKAFKQTDREHDLVENGGSRVVLPADTRWCSQRDACVSLKTNLSAMRKVAANDDSDKIPSSVKSLLYDEHFLEQVYSTIELLDPVSQLINTCQGKDTSVSEAVELWLQLRLPDGYEEKMKFVEKRRKHALNVYSLAANVLDPRFRGEKLSEDAISDVEDFVFEKLDTQGVTSFQQYREKSGKFAELFDKAITSPRTFWFYAKRQHQSLANFALRLINIPASSAQLERLFSNWSYIHNPSRNRLEFERSKKLVQIYYTLKMQDQASDEY